MTDVTGTALFECINCLLPGAEMLLEPEPMQPHKLLHSLRSVVDPGLERLPLVGHRLGRHIEPRISY